MCSDCGDNGRWKLIEMYHAANCNLFSDISCLEEMLGCASAVVGYNDWGQCMNTQSTYTNCAHMPGLFLDNSEQVLACVEQIEGADCTASQLCQGGEVVTEAGPCNSVVELIMQNCGPY